MSDLLTDEIFTDGQQNIAASNMNGIVGRSHVQPDMIANKTASATMNVADQFLVLKTDNTLARARFDTIVNSTGSSLALASTTANGMLRQVSGLTSDYVGGDNNCHARFSPSTVPTMNSTAIRGVSPTSSRDDHTHPSDTSRLSTSGGSVVGNIAVTGVVSVSSDFSVGGTFYGVSASLSGNLGMNGTLTVMGALNMGAGTYISADNISATGGITAAGISSTGAMSAASMGVNGVITSNTGGLAFTDVGAGFAYKIRWDGTNLFIYVGATPMRLTLASSRRLKRNIGPASIDALAAVQAIPMHSYEQDIGTLDNKNTVQYKCGWMAEDLEEHIPGSVDRIEIGDGLEVLHPVWQPILGVAFRAIQQLTERVAALEGVK